MLNEFLNKDIKALYRDGADLKIGRGILEKYTTEHIKIRGDRGVLIIKIKNIEKLGLSKNAE